MNNNLNQSVIAITGSGSGIGRALALECAKHGAHIAISDIDLKAVEETGELVNSSYPQTKVDVQQLDVSDKSQVSQWADSVAQHYGQVNVIINNAGVALAVDVESMQYEDFNWLMDINFWGVVYGTKSFLPHLKKSSWGHIVNISSLFGLISTPNNSAYHAAKFAVRGFSESLRIELMMTDKRIGLSSVHPGGIKTNIANYSRDGGAVIGELAGMSVEERKQQFNDKYAKTTPEQAANLIVNGIIKKRGRILIGTDAKILDILQRFLPVKYQYLVAKLFS